MRKKWTREQIIHHIVECEANAWPLKVGEPGVSQAVYQAGTRLFGSWRNAIQAAGIPPQRANCGEKWPPARILMIIRNLARRSRPLSSTQLERRYGSMLTAARRLFGSWTKAVVAAGVDPTKLQRVVPWTPERVIESILNRALRNESLTTRFTQPRSLVAAGQRFFGTWATALQAAGLDPNAIANSPIPSPKRTIIALATGAQSVHQPGRPWTKEMIFAAIQTRFQQQKPMSADEVAREQRPLYRAATRRFTNWNDALISAGVHLDHLLPCPRRRGRPKASSARKVLPEKSQSNEMMRPVHPV